MFKYEKKKEPVNQIVEVEKTKDMELEEGARNSKPKHIINLRRCTHTHTRFSSSKIMIHFMRVNMF